MTVTGCGEVPNLLDGLLRTVLSGATSASNAALSLKGLIEKFGTQDTIRDGRKEKTVNWEAVSQASVETIYQALKSGGLGKIKAESMNGILTKVRQENKDGNQNGKLSLDYIGEMSAADAIAAMTEFKGVGIKTASCVALFRMKLPSFAVDTHVHRICKMLGWVPAHASADQTFYHCDSLVPDYLKYSLHQQFWDHGQSCLRCSGNANDRAKQGDSCPLEHLVNRNVGKKAGKRQVEENGEDDTRSPSPKRKRNSNKAETKVAKQAQTHGEKRAGPKRAKKQKTIYDDHEDKVEDSE
jgi:endonuclease III